MTDSFTKILASAQSHVLQLHKQLLDISRAITATGTFNEFKVENLKTKCPENFSLPEFLLKFEGAVFEIAHICAKIQFSHRKPSLTNVKESQELMNTIEGAADNLVCVFNSLPEESGKRFYLDMLNATKGILKAVVHFICSLNVKESKRAKESHKYAENVFSNCEEVLKLPKNNLESVLRFLHKEKWHLLDALQDIDEEVKSNYSGLKYGEEIDNTEIWNNQDKKLLPFCVALVKTTRTCLKNVIIAIKSKGDCSTSTNIAQLDDIAFIVEDLTTVVDNFIFAFYPPMNHRDVKRDALKVVNTVQRLLNQVENSHFIDNEDQSWLNVLIKSVDKNNNKFQPLFSDDYLIETSETGSTDDED